MTLVEILVATVIGALVLAVAGSLMVYNSRALATLTNYADLDQYSRRAVDRLSQDIRQASALVSFTSTELQFNSQRGTNAVYYTYDSTARTLARREGSSREVLLVGCDALAFTVYGRNNSSNSFDQFPVSSAEDAKLIKLNWTCSRELLGSAVNTESVQTAKIVMRKL